MEISFEHQVRVRYAEVDQMGFVYHGNYALYWDEARTEWLRFRGISYREMEERGTMMPVHDIYIKYFKAGKYDDLLTIRATIKEKPGVRIRFDFETFNEQGEKLNEGYVTLIFVKKENLRPMLMPKEFEMYFREFYPES